MNLTRNRVQRKTHAIPALRFEQQQLTSCSGLLLFQLLFSRLQLKERIRHCLGKSRAAYDRATLLLGLIVHLLLGHRELRDARYYRHDPMVLRVLGLGQLPDVATVSRSLAAVTNQSVDRLRGLLRQLVLDRLAALALPRITLDFDGSVLSTSRHAEGTAVGYNRRKKGARSYYPLFCTLAQTGQVFDVLHRPGNVHDSQGAREFILHCVEQIRSVLPGVRLEARLDSAFFSDAIVSELDRLGIEFTLSVPFERFVELKRIIESRRRWHRLDGDLACFKPRWKPKSWRRRYRLIVARTRRAQRQKGPLQLDLFEPMDWTFEFSVMVTNKTVRACTALRFHHGRGAQEGVFAELKSQGQLDYVPTRTLVGNQTYMLAALLAYNLTRELQMIAHPPSRRMTEQRSALWPFAQLKTLRNTLILRAGRFTEPKGSLTLTVSANHAVRGELLHYVEHLLAAA